MQDRDSLDLTAGRGIAAREFPMKPAFGFADYLLYLDRNAIGAVEAKAEGTLTGVEAHSAKYAAGLPDNLPAHKRPLPFLFESNGAVIYFTNGLDPTPRSRQAFNFPRPETLADTLNRQPSKTLEQVLEYVAQGGVDPEALTTLAGRLARRTAQHRQSDTAHVYVTVG